MKEDIYFGAVVDEEISDWFIENKTIDRTPSFLLVRYKIRRKSERNVPLPVMEIYVHACNSYCIYM